MIRYSRPSPESERLSGRSLNMATSVQRWMTCDGRIDGFGLGAVGRLLVDRGGVGALGDQLGRDPGLVVDLDQEDRPAVLHQPGRAGPWTALTRLSGLISIPIKQCRSSTSWIARIAGSPPGRIERLVEPGLLVAAQRLPSMSSASTTRFACAERGWNSTSRTSGRSSPRPVDVPAAQSARTHVNRHSRAGRKRTRIGRVLWECENAEIRGQGRHTQV